MKKLLSVFMSAIMLTTMFTGLEITVDAKDAYTNNSYSRACCHDPSIVRGDDGKYYAFGSHIACAVSDDLMNWSNTSSTMEGDGTRSQLSFDGMSWKENCSKALEWLTVCQNAEGRAEEDMEYGCWAPCVIYNDTMGKWCMYVSFSYWGTPNSVIALATSDTIDGPYKFDDTMIYSGFTNADKLYADTDVYTKSFLHTNVPKALGGDFLSAVKSNSYGWFRADGSYNCDLGMFPNCIDPTAFTDKNGDMWMVYGSFSGGTFVVPLDEETGFVDYAYMKAHGSEGYDPYFGMQISKTCVENEGTGEGPFIVYDEQSDYYYFYLTYGGLAGDGGYNIREYRSKNPYGPYVDKAGNKATDMKNTGVKLMGNYKLSCQPTAYLSGGHSSSIVDNDGRMYQVYHTRFATDNGWGHQIRAHQMLRTSDGWAVMLPYEYQGERVNAKGYTTSSIVGTYEFVNHTNMTHRLEYGADLSTIILPTQKIELAADGTIYCLKEYGCSITNAKTSSKSVSGSWSKQDGTYYATFRINGIVYNGVFCKQKDESAKGKETMTFAAIGTNNAEIWGVQTNNHTPDFAISVTKATPTADGKKANKCRVCGIESSSTKISKVAGVTLSATVYTYDGKAKKPSVTVKDGNGKKLSTSSYTVTYSGKRKDVGQYKVTVKLKGNYSGTVTKYFTIKPKSTTISKLSSAKKGFTVKWKKNAVQTSGYQLQCATDKSFTENKKAVTVSGSKKTSATVSGLKPRKLYYVRIRTYKTVNGKKYYSSWSNYKSVMTMN